MAPRARRAAAAAALAAALVLCSACAARAAAGAAVAPKRARSVGEQVAAVKDDADKLLSALVGGPLSGQAWDRLAEFTDTVGNRVSGSANLARAVDYMKAALAADGLENVHGENATVPHWSRGRESATMLEPRWNYTMNILGLGTSVGTGDECVQAEVLVVESFEELANRSAEAAGRIVLYNQQCNWTAQPTACYGSTVGYRTQGASKAAAVGAVASLVRTVGAFSIGSPHTGVQEYAADVPKIPAAAVTIEDADAMARMQARGQRIVVRLCMEAQNLPPVVSQNVVAEIKGSEFPDQVVIVSGHLDSWDVGVGAMDDGGGAVVSWQALSAVRALGLRPRRTLRVVMWTCEEFGGIGSQQYYQQHKAEAPSVSLAMESDIGVFTPLGVSFTGSANATLAMQQVVQLLQPIAADTLYPGGSETDNGWWAQSGVPTGSLKNENERYFWFHHSAGDQMPVLTPEEMDKAAAVFAVTAYTVANLDDVLPRD